MIDAFALSDHIINSPLGKWDGSVYESYFAQVSERAYSHSVFTNFLVQVQASNPLPKEHPYFTRLIKPLLDRENSAIDDPEAAMGLDDELREMAEERAAAKEAARGREE